MVMVRPGQTVVTEFTTQNPSTGAAQDADGGGGPTGTLVKNGVDTAIVITIANKATGVYSASFTVPSTYTTGDVLTLRIAVTVNAVAGKGEVWHAVVSLSVLLSPGANDVTFIVKHTETGLPMAGVEVWFSTDTAHANIVWRGVTDTFGIARDVNDGLPKLSVGTYYAWRYLSGEIFADPVIITVV